MGKKRKKSSQGQAADVVSEAMASALAPTPPPPEARVEIEAAPALPEPARSQPALTEEKAAELIASAPELVDLAPQLEPDALEPPSSVAAPASEAAPSTSRPRKRRKKRVTKPPVSREVLDQKIDRLEAKLEVKKTQAAQAAREGFDSSVDDTSVPPVEQEIHEEFFAAGEKDHPLPRAESGPYSALDLRHAQKMTPAAQARRAHLSRYVKWSVGAAAFILFLGIGVQRLRGHPSDEPVRKEVAHATELVAPPQETTNAVTPPPVETTTVAEMKIEELPDEVLGADGGKVEGKVEDPDKKPEDMPAEKPKNAWQEKQAAKAALERGSSGAAIAAGERSVALDPSDGEAWLVLGGAYQAMGNNGQAKRCYNACISQGKKGPTGDCKDMLGSL